MKVSENRIQKRRSSGTTAAIHLPSNLRDRIDWAAGKCGLSKQDFYRLCLEIGMIYWKEAGSVASALYRVGKTPNSMKEVRKVCVEYGFHDLEEKRENHHG